MSDGLTRRDLVAAGLAGAAAATLPGPLAAVANPLLAPSTPLQPELITVTPTGFAAWWVTSEPSDTTVRLRGPGFDGSPITLERGVRIHAARIDALEPGASYRYELFSGGRRIRQNPFHPGRFRTLRPPSGQLIATVALLNDIHVGERCSGTLFSAGDQSIPPCNEGDDYAIRMTSACVRAIRRIRPRPDLLLVNGDLTDRGRPEEIERALSVLRRARIPVAVTRGNHDRRYEQCGDDDDCLRMAAFPERRSGDHALTWSRRLGRGLELIALDSNDPDTGAGRLDLGGQLGWLEGELVRTARQGRRVVIAFHHPVTKPAITLAMPPGMAGVSLDQGGRDFLALIRGHPHVSMVLGGHTHRNFVSYDEQIGRRLVFLENGAAKEYPGGFGLLRFHTDGVVRTYHRVAEPFSREWVERTAGQAWGLHPSYTRGPLSSRAFVQRWGRAGPPASLPLLPDRFVGS